jgi:hypothetical protein
VGVQAYLLYFNLPEIIIKNMILPKRLFPNPKINNANEPDNFPNTMNTVEWFESHSNHARSPNLIVFEVEDPDSGSNIVCGGYSSCGWTSHSDLFGDSSCFVFNLTQNIKLQAMANVASRFTFITPVS